MTLPTEDAQTKETRQGPDEIIQEWLLDLLRSYKDKEIADILGISSSTIWKIKNGHQRLKAGELLMLHECLDVPLPSLGLRSGERGGAMPDHDLGPDDPKLLFDFAYNRMKELESRKPIEGQLNQFELLEQVFHIMKTIQDTPQAMQLKGANK